MSANPIAGERYVHAHRPYAPELHRLRLLEHRYDQATFRRFGELGDLTGAWCLEVGAGAGSVARWLGQRVGPTGRVVAVDLDTRFLTDPQGGNVEVRPLDIECDYVEPESFDIAHCRALLLHLVDPAVGLAAMVAALRPGGRVLLEDADFITLTAADDRHARSAPFDRVNSAVLAYSANLGTFKPFFGRGLAALVRRGGLVDCRYEATAAVRWGGTPEAEYLRCSNLSVLGGAARPAVLSDSDVMDWEAALSDPSFCYYDALSIAVWARKPDHAPVRS